MPKRYLVRSEALHKLNVLRRASRDDMRPTILQHLDQERAHRSTPTINQHPIPSGERLREPRLRIADESYHLPRRESGRGQPRSSVEANRSTALRQPLHPRSFLDQHRTQLLAIRLER